MDTTKNCFSDFETSNSWIKELFETIKKVLPKGPDIVPLYKPTIIGNEWNYIKQCLDSGWVSSVGSFVDHFEKDLAEYIGVKHVVATVNGTAALHIALKLIGVKAGDEVLMPSLTFVATANAVTYCGAQPHFVESEPVKLGIDFEKLEEYLRSNTLRKGQICINKHSGSPIKAIIVMHTFGHPVDILRASEICDQFGIALVEDAAEALGSLHNNRCCGGFGKVNAISFNGNKIITTGGGGAILTNDDELANQAKHITTTAKLSHPYFYNHDTIGYNYRMPNINAALGIGQLEQMAKVLLEKRKLAGRYVEAFAQFEGANFIDEPEGCKSNYWLNTIIIDDNKSKLLTQILEFTNNNGIMTRPIWTPMHQLPMFSEAPRMNLNVVENLAHRILNLPSSVAF